MLSKAVRPDAEPAMSAEQHNSARNNHAAATAVAVVAAVPALAPGASPAHPQPVPVAHAQPLSPPLVQDLPDELIQGGWSKCWSRRENRPYFYNRFTKQSLWELPALGQHDVISDPLGLNAAPVGGAPGAPAAGATGASVEDAALRKRRLSEEIGAGVAGAASAVSKRTKSEDVMPVTPVTPVPKGWKAEAGFASPTQKPKPPTLPFPIYWNLEVPTNAVIKERGLFDTFHPHPEVELFRAQLTVRLRHQYQELCQQREGVDAPRESFNRWLLERKVIDKGRDPMLPSDCEPVVSVSMFREILNDIPIRLSRIKYRDDAKKQLFKYAEAAKRMIDNRNASPDSRKIVKWNVEETFNWLRKEPSPSKEDYLDRLDHLRRQCGPHLAEVAKESVEGICAKIFTLSCDYVKRIRDKNLDMLKENKLALPEEAAAVAVAVPPAVDRLVYCFPARLSIPPWPLPRVEMHTENDMTCLRYRGEMVKINQNYFNKLEHLYRLGSTDDPRFEKFLARVWCLLRRYRQTMFGVGGSEGAGLHGALPVPVFEALHRHFGVTFECFASPLNCYFRQYCSAFADTDGYFGSRGPILDFNPVSGSFEANPPFGEELMNAMVDHFENLMSSSTEPLSFIVFVPEWREPVTPALLRMEESRFKRRQVLVPAFEHEYRNGAQHVCKGEDLHIRAVHGTAIIFLQNDAGFARWEPTADRLRLLLEAYRVQGRQQQQAQQQATPSTPSTTAPSSTPSHTASTSTSSPAVESSAGGSAVVSPTTSSAGQGEGSGTTTAAAAGQTENHDETKQAVPAEEPKKEEDKILESIEEWI
ncbi:mRNA (2'-O-methyladenosine-N(6)-)-methyltransferase isoform X1 [Lampetra fluviatilis]